MLRDGLKSQDIWTSGLRADSISGASLAINASSQTLGGALTQSSGNHSFTAGSPFMQGIVYPFTARSDISGGMFVAASGNLAFAAPANTKHPIGVALGTVASGGTVNVLVAGIYPMIAEGTIAAGASAMMGAGAGLNTVVSAATYTSGCRHFGVLDAAASGTTSTVFIQL